MNKIEELIEELLAAAEAYYNGEDELLEDEEYDDKVSALRAYAAENTELLNDERVQDLLEETVAAGVSPAIGTKTVFHTAPMQSLEKANSRDEVKKYYDKLVSAGAQGFSLQAKLDGFAIEAVYENKKLVQISTRGDGIEGEDLSYLINHKEITFLGLPLQLNELTDCSVRGELFARHSQFEEFNKNREKAQGSKFKNSRNGVVGLIKKAKDGVGYPATLTFCVYSWNSNNVYQDLKSSAINQESFIEINSLTNEEYKNAGGQGSLSSRSNFQELMTIIDNFGEKRPMFDIPTDGVVIKPINEKYMFDKMGATGHHPIAFIAFKYPTTKKKTTVLDIVLSVGKTGKITPKAIVKPTEIDGITIQAASCHNFNWMYSKGIRVGSTVMITRANDVIPAITTVISAGPNKEIPIPDTCPSCGKPLVSDDYYPPKSLKCENKECPSRIFFELRGVVSKDGLNIKGLNNIGLQALCDTGKVKNVADFFKLTSADLSELVMGYNKTGSSRKFGVNRANKIIEYIMLAKENTPAYKLLNCLGFDGIGGSNAKLLLKKLNSIEKVLETSESDLKDIEGFGEAKASELVKYNKKAKEIYKKLVDSGVKIDNGLAKETKQSNGVSFAISGKVPNGFSNRNAFVDYMENLGFTFNSSIKKTTDFVLGDENDSSSKIKKAKQFNIKIIDPDLYKTIVDENTK